METKKILLVDDDADFVATNRLILEAEGYLVLEARDSSSALSVAQEQKPDLIVLDVMMGYDTEGIELSRKFRAEATLRKVPILLLTGIRSVMGLSAPPEKEENWLPVQMVLEKPVAPAEFLERVKDCFAIPRSEFLG